MADIANETLDCLEWRLNRLEFYFHRDEKPTSGGKLTNPANNTTTVRSRLVKLERDFADLCSRSAAAAQLVELYTTHPELFSDPSRQISQAEDSAAAKLPVVLSLAGLVEESAVHLHELREKQVPDANGLNTLLALQPRLAQAQATQEAQVHELADLRQRTAQMLTTWYADSVLAGGEQWSDWERRLTKVEQTVRRREVERAKEDREV